ncbi:MAG: hypothetical protein GY870_08845 [archaeon]|nr:hypothetical protein [archaeon]
MTTRKTDGSLLTASGIITLLIHLGLDYPFCGNICYFCVWTFYVVGAILIIAGLSLLLIKPKPPGEKKERIPYGSKSD